MRRGKQRALGPYRHRNGWLVVTREADGARRSFRFPKETDAVAFRDEYNEAAATAAHTVADALDAYEHHYVVVKGNKPGPFAETRRRIVRLVGDDQLELSEITPRRAASVYQALVDEGLSADSHQGMLTHTRTFFAWCVKQRWLAASPFADVERQGKKRKGKDKLTHDEARTWLHTCWEWAAAGEWRALMASFTLLFNIRGSEVCGIKIRDIDDDGRVLQVMGTKTRAAVRRLRIPAEARALIVAHRDLRLLEVEAARKAGERDDGYLWGPVIHKHQFVRAWVLKMCLDAKVPEVCSQSMRGLHADAALEEGTSPEALARSMGHETFAVTSAHYLSAGAKDAASERARLRLIEADRGREEGMSDTVGRLRALRALFAREDVQEVMLSGEEVRVLFAAEAERDRLRRDYLMVADALLPASTGPEELAAEARRLRTTLATTDQALTEHVEAAEAEYDDQEACIKEQQREMDAIRARFAPLKSLRPYCLSTFMGGYHDEKDIAVFRHGMETVCRIVEATLDPDGEKE